MRIYENKSNKELFDENFIKELEDHGSDIDDIIYNLVNDIISNIDKYPNIYSVSDSSYYYNTVEDLVVERLIEIQDEAIEKAEDQYDLEDILRDLFWEDTSEIDHLEFNLGD